MFFHELDADAAAGQRLHDAAKIIEISCETVHAVDDDHVAGTSECHQRLQLWPLRIFAGRLVRKDPVEGPIFELAIGILIERADPDTTDVLANQDAVPLTTLSEQLYDLSLLLSRNPKMNPNLTVIVGYPDVSLGYSPNGRSSRPLAALLGHLPSPRRVRPRLRGTLS